MSYFGQLDANEDELEQLRSWYLPRHEQGLKSGNLKQGDQIIVGIKGSGKTALRRYIQASNKDSLHVLLDVEHQDVVLPAFESGTTSGRVKEIVSMELMRIFHQRVTDESQQWSGEVVKKLSSIREKAIEAMKALNFELYGATLNMNELIDRVRSAGKIKTTWRNMANETIDAIKPRKAYIFIDDAEDVFSGLEKHPHFIEALARAVTDINKESGDSIHVFLFLKYGIWRKWFENPREYDRVSDRIKFLTWDNNALIELIARRIAKIHSIKISTFDQATIRTLWEKEFEISNDDSWHAFTDRLVGLCVNGPRDILSLCNMLKKQDSSNGPTAPSTLDKVIDQYSESKLMGIHADFNDVYPEIKDFVRKVFHGCNAEYDGEDMIDYLDNNAVTSDSIVKKFEGRKWFGTSSASNLLRIMYSIGIVGLRNGDDIVYAIKNPRITDSELPKAKIVIHPAFRNTLGIS